MLDPITVVTLKPQYKKLSNFLIQTYIDLCYNNYPNISDNVLQLAVFHYLEIELNGTNRVIERTGDQDTIKFQPLSVNGFWDMTDPGRMFKQLMNRGRSLMHVRPRSSY